jgi:hypothetical protein
MVGIWQSYADIYLIVAGAAMLLGFGLPLTLAPKYWARVFRWEMPSHKKFTLFLERSVGIFIIVMSLFAFVASQQAQDIMSFYYDMMLVTFAGMILLHVYGAIRKIQPTTETLEIILWIVLTIVTILFYPLFSD